MDAIEKCLDDTFAVAFKAGVESNKSVLDAYDPINAPWSPPWTFRDSIERELNEIQMALKRINDTIARLDSTDPLVFKETKDCVDTYENDIRD